MTSPAIQNAKLEVMLNIPEEILDAAFRNELTNTGITREAAVEEIIIKRIVTSMCATIAGKSKLIPMEDSWAHTSNSANPSIQSYTVFEIPKENRENRPIIDCINTVFGSGGLYTQGIVLDQAVTLQTYSDALLLSKSHVDTTPPMAQRLTNSSIRIPAYSAIGSNFSVECLLGYDETFTHIPRASYSAFANIVKCCTKIYIYNKLIIKINSGEVQYGAELGAFKDTIMEYKDEKDVLPTLLDEFKMQTDLDPEKLLKLALICL